MSKFFWSPTGTSLVEGFSVKLPRLRRYNDIAFANIKCGIHYVSLTTNPAIEPKDSSRRSRLLFDGLDTCGLACDNTLYLNGEGVAAITFPSDYINRRFYFYYAGTGKIYDLVFGGPDRTFDCDYELPTGIDLPEF